MTVKIIIYAMIIISLLATVSSTSVNNTLKSCEYDIDTNDCVPVDCQELCGCDLTYIYDKDKEECVLNIAYLKEITASRNYFNTENDMVLEDNISTKLQEKVDKIFRGIVASALFFVACCSVCIVSVLIFCCHIRRSDRKLKNEVNALAKKMRIDIRKKRTTPKKSVDQLGESCNVVVQDANVMCV